MEDEYDYDDSPDGIGCWNCNGGWKHACMDDMCRGSYEAESCEDAYPCPTCNPRGEVA